MSAFFIFCMNTLGLVKISGISVRMVSMAGFFLTSCRHLKLSNYFVVNIILVSSFVIFYSFFYFEGSIKYSNYFALHIRNLVCFLLLYSFLKNGNFDASNILTFLTYFVFVCAIANIFIIVFYPKPWIAIAAFTGTEEEGFAHLYSRLILPFGTPNQLGFVAGLLSLYNFFSGRKFLSFIMLIPMLGAASNSSLVPFIVIVFTYIVLNFIKSNFNFMVRWRHVFFVLLISILTISLIYLFNDFEISILGGRSQENVIESISRHLLLRSRTIEGIADFSFLQYFYGVGPGNSYQYIGGTYSFTVPLTLFYEFGLFGLYIYIVHLKGIILFKSNFSFYIITFVVMASFIYQLNNDITYYILPLLITYQLMQQSNENNLSV